MVQLFETVIFEKKNDGFKKCSMKLDLIYIYIYIFGKSYQNVFVYFQKLVFGNIKKKQFSCILEIKNMLG